MYKKMRNLAGTYYNKLFYLKNHHKMPNNNVTDFYNKHKGERCFIIGCGPSINKTDFSIIKDEILIGVNTLYRGMEKFKIKPQYWGCVDSKVLQENYSNLFHLDTTLFLAGSAGRKYLTELRNVPKSTDIFVLKSSGDIIACNKMGLDVAKGVNGGGTVVIDVCLHIAYYMGFKEIYLLGCDSDYSGIHHFDGSQAENLSGMAIGDNKKVFDSYKICKKIFEEDGRNIYNATVGGKLEVFERRKLEVII